MKKHDDWAPLEEAVSANPNNPRRITATKLRRLGKSLREYGDLSGVIMNRRTKQLVGGHQRVDAFKSDKDAKIVITESFAEPKSDGTVRIGYVLAFGSRYSYREVDWDAKKEAAANIAANQHGGDFDDRKLQEIITSLDDIDRDLLGFDEEELQRLLKSVTPPSEFEDVDENIPVQHKCPKCGYKWSGKPA